VLFRPAEPIMRRVFSHAELDRSGAASVKYGLIVAALSAAVLTVALAIAARLATLPAGSIG
jgi:Flp pilus assembly pilin Flp